MRKTEEIRAIYKVQAHLNPQDYAELEKYCDKKNKTISSVVREFIKERLANV